MKKLFFVLLLFHVIISCKQKEEKSNSNNNNDSISSSANYSLSVNQDSSVNDNSKNHLPVNTHQTAATQLTAQMQAVNIEVVTYKNKDISGYGYDILIDGVPKFHQPHIPAIPGNNGFKSEEDAKKTGELAKQKILNHISPPTIEVRELDSLGIK
jgi:hypothetical protein